MSKMEKFLKESNLSAEARKLIEEAWEEEKSAIAADIREDMKSRYKDDIAQVVEGLNTLVQTIITENMSDLYAEKRKLSEDRVRVRQSLTNFSSFANGIMAEEIKQMRSETSLMNESVARFVGFSQKVLAEELHEFHSDKRQLVEARVKLIAEGTRQINEAKQRFIKTASESAATFIAENTAKNMNELRSNIMEAKQNRFGRKLFETFAAEFMATQFNENAVLKNLNEALARKDNEVHTVTAALHEARTVSTEIQRKMNIMEDNATRSRVIAELTKPLTDTQKKIMESLLERSMTEHLAEDFKKYHKAVLKESNSKSTQSFNKPSRNDSVLNETNSREVTGNRPAKTVTESELSDDDKSILSGIMKNAGIR